MLETVVSTFILGGMVSGFLIIGLMLLSSARG
jgi:hypothetical protein